MLRSHNLRYAAPTSNPEIAPYWEGCKTRKLLIKHCNGCNRSHFYPRSICPRCLSEDTAWKRASGNAEIYAFSVMRRAKEPYAIAFIVLEEGVAMMTNIVDCDLDELRIGQKIRVTWQNAEDGTPIPVFAPV
jgi:uncharacterized protein